MGDDPWVYGLIVPLAALAGVAFVWLIEWAAERWLSDDDRNEWWD